MPDNYASQPLADLKAIAAERVFVECPVNWTNPSLLPNAPVHPAQCDCWGDGKKWLLGRPLQIPSDPTIKLASPWVFNDKEDAVIRAIRAMGLSLTYDDPIDPHPEYKGDIVTIRDDLGSEIASVMWNTGLKGTHALLVALLRAVDSQENKEND